MQEETAPPFEKWSDHLKAIGDRELSDLARDYSWLNGQARPQEARDEFHSRREAIFGELERRGMHAIADQCRQPS
jgi:hypothetical protein